MEYNMIKKLGEGSAGDAYLLDDGRIVIVGKREDSFGTYKAMFEKIQKLDGKITAVNYPKIYKLIYPCEKFPFGAVVEEYVNGEELRKENARLNKEQKKEIGKVLAEFITEMHNIDGEGDKEEEIRINLAKYDRSLGMLKEYLNAEVYVELLKIKERYKEFMEAKNFCTTHGDLNAGNIMIGKDGKVSGIIDFGNMEYYVPEIEFVHMYFFDKDVYDAIVEDEEGKYAEGENFLNISYGMKNSNARVLSNLYPLVFRFRGRKVKSIEGVLQGIKYEDKNIQNMVLNNRKSLKNKKTRNRGQFCTIVAFVFFYAKMFSNFFIFSVTLH